MASPASLTGQAFSEPHAIRIYLSYDVLPAKELGNVCTGVGRLYESAVRHVSSGRRVLVFRRGEEEVVIRKPFLAVEESHTGSSIKLKYSESWFPTINIEENELVVAVPRQTVIPLAVVLALGYAANQYYDLRNKDLDHQLKQVELRLKQNELNAEEIQNNDKIMKQAQSTVRPLLKSSHIQYVSVNGLSLKMSNP